MRGFPEWSLFCCWNKDEGGDQPGQLRCTTVASQRYGDVCMLGEGHLLTAICACSMKSIYDGIWLWKVWVVKSGKRVETIIQMALSMCVRDFGIGSC